MNIKNFFRFFKKKSDEDNWAEEEIRIALVSIDDNEKYEYANNCYQHALKAYKTILKGYDDGNYYSIGQAKQTLDRLLNGYPIVAIQDTPDTWEFSSENTLHVKTYQCKRFSSLFKHVDPDGTVTYKDNNYCYCTNNDGLVWHNWFVSKMIYDLFPLTMPYYPQKPIKVFCEQCLTDRINGNFDTLAIYEAELSNGIRKSINRYFKDFGDDLVEIDKTEYDVRKAMHDSRVRREKERPTIG